MRRYAIFLFSTICLLVLSACHTPTVAETVEIAETEETAETADPISHAFCGGDRNNLAHRHTNQHPTNRDAGRYTVSHPDSSPTRTAADRI